MTVRPSGNTHPMSSTQTIEKPQTELDVVEAWRLESLLRAGWELEKAELLAIAHDVDLHVACRMLAQGCKQELAFDILT